ncbi:hypothetical protein [Arthrobacter roseus]|uniref:hypothetical protein n=1 Tax=Arthrobacter roseus TaxID=136274 RepID=UPI0019641452|nr:hypothetical protein [Arthrobacter roseus]MBM7847696.1 hypothetical protein [Arthrobacter roseus]
MNPETFDPRQALQVSSETEARTGRTLQPRVALQYAIWGTAWLIGYGVLHGSSHGWLPLEYSTALIIFGVALFLGVASSIGLSIAVSIGIRGDSAFQGAVYGWTWMLAFVVVFFAASRIAQMGADQQFNGMMVNALAVLVVGMMYMFGGALWRDIPMLVLGIWFLLVNVMALIAGPEQFITVYLTLGVGGFYAAALVTYLQQRRQP